MKTELKRILIGWVLLLTLLPFFVVKAVHRHTDSIDVCATSSNSGNSSHEANCQICHFNLYPFTETEQEVFDFVLSFNIIEPIPYICSVSLARLYSEGLRAPPASWLV